MSTSGKPISEPKLTILSKTESTNSDYNGDCDVGIVVLTKSNVEEIIRVREIVRSLAKRPDFFQLELWNSLGHLGKADFYDAENMAVAEYASAKATLVHGEAELVVRAERTNVSTLLCDPRQVAWECGVKHADVYVRTDYVSYDALEAWLKSHTKRRPKGTTEVPLCPEDGHLLERTQESQTDFTRGMCPACEATFSVSTVKGRLVLKPVEAN